MGRPWWGIAVFLVNSCIDVNKKLREKVAVSFSFELKSVKSKEMRGMGVPRTKQIGALEKWKVRKWTPQSATAFSKDSRPSTFHSITPSSYYQIRSFSSLRLQESDKNACL